MRNSRSIEACQNGLNLKEYLKSQLGTQSYNLTLRRVKELKKLIDSQAFDELKLRELLAP